MLFCIRFFGQRFVPLRATFSLGGAGVVDVKFATVASLRVVFAVISDSCLTQLPLRKVHLFKVINMMIEGRNFRASFLNGRLLLIKQRELFLRWYIIIELMPNLDPMQYINNG